MRLKTLMPKPTGKASFALLALFAMLFQAVLPLGNAIAADAGIEQIVICTPNGIETVSLDADGNPIETETEVVCSSCILQAAVFLVSPDNHNPDIAYLAETVEVWSQIEFIPVNHQNSTPRLTRAPPLFS
ncbi:MAG: hypothetical protein R3261_11165 [Alphaproteobacteria bacterium]|nr:hypothetical protein [Alphaproteobacteria bacterium]